MSFELTEFTKAKLLDVEVLSQKNRAPDENPGAKLPMELQISNDMLGFFDGQLKSFLFTKAGSGSPQPELAGVEPVSDTPNLTKIGAKLGQFSWSHDLTGYTLVIDQGLGGKRSNIEIADCTLSGWRMTPKEGGTVVLRFDVESADVSEQSFGKLAKLKSREISMTLAPPEVAQADLVTPAPVRSTKKSEKAAQQQSATDAFIERHAPTAGAH